MICYQDEKMYGPPPEGVSLEELQKRVEELEVEIYGHVIDHEKLAKNEKPDLILDVKKGNMVPRDQAEYY